MERICRIWEIELQTVLEIIKQGHRKRILCMVVDGNQITTTTATTTTSTTTTSTTMPLSNSFDIVHNDKISSSSLVKLYF